MKLVNRDLKVRIKFTAVSNLHGDTLEVWVTAYSAILSELSSRPLPDSVFQRFQTPQLVDREIYNPPSVDLLLEFDAFPQLLLSEERGSFLSSFVFSMKYFMKVCGWLVSIGMNNFSSRLKVFRIRRFANFAIRISSLKISCQMNVRRWWSSVDIWSGRCSK